MSEIKTHFLIPPPSSPYPSSLSLSLPPQHTSPSHNPRPAPHFPATHFPVTHFSATHFPALIFRRPIFRHPFYGTSFSSNPKGDSFKSSICQHPTLFSAIVKQLFASSLLFAIIVQKGEGKIEKKRKKEALIHLTKTK